MNTRVLPGTFAPGYQECRSFGNRVESDTRCACSHPVLLQAFARTGRINPVLLLRLLLLSIAHCAIRRDGREHLPQFVLEHFAAHSDGQILDDDDDMRALVVLILSERYEVHSARDGVEGLESARRLRPDRRLPP